MFIYFLHLYVVILAIWHTFHPPTAYSIWFAKMEWNEIIIVQIRLIYVYTHPRREREIYISSIQLSAQKFHFYLKRNINLCTVLSPFLSRKKEENMYGRIFVDGYAWYVMQSLSPAHFLYFQFDCVCVCACLYGSKCWDCFVFSFSLSFVYDAIKSKIEVVIFDLGYDITVGSAIWT